MDYTTLLLHLPQAILTTLIFAAAVIFLYTFLEWHESYQDLSQKKYVIKSYVAFLLFITHGKDLFFREAPVIGIYIFTQILFYGHL
jgi:uncharacterized protein involved in response to NO